MKAATKDLRLAIGRMVIVIAAVVFMAFSVVVAVTPLRGEEVYAGTTFAELQTSNPPLANLVWHYTMGIGILVFGVNSAIALLAWKGLSRGATVAGYLILVLALTLLFGIHLAHVPIGHTEFGHIGIPSILLGILLVGLAISAKPVFSPGPQSDVPRSATVAEDR